MLKRGRGSKSDSEDDDVKTEERLEAMVFGDERVLVDRLLSESVEKEEEDREEGPGDVGLVRKLERKPAWTDEDDKLEKVDVAGNKRLRKLRKTEEEHTLDGATFSTRLRTQFERLAGTPSWAKLPAKKHNDEDEDEEDILLKRSGKLLATGTKTLPRGIINIKSTKAANWEKPAKAVIQALEFHPTSYVLLVGGFHKTLDLFQIDGRDNPHLQGVYFRDFPIHCAHFTPDGEQIVVTSRTRQFYVYDLKSGKTLHVPIISGMMSI
jgi:U3 small nucleolar RNA-associated protein 18